MNKKDWFKIFKINSKNFHFYGLFFSMVVASAWLFTSHDVKRFPAQEIDEVKALKYLDSRSANWLTTSISNSHDGGTRCLSCHTTLSYTLTRPEYGDSPELQEIKKFIELRVQEFNGSGFRGAWYGQFEEGSLSTETVINAVSLTSMDLPKGEGLNPITEMALNQMWDRQIKNGVNAGGFAWLDGYALEPLESKNAGYWASSLVASTVSDIPGYTERPEVKEHIKKLKKYLADHFDEQNLHNKLMAIEADKKLGFDVIPKSKIKKTLTEVLALSEEGGGWDLHKLIGRAGIGAPDNYATAIVVKAFVEIDQGRNSKIKEGLGWLRGRQNLSKVNISSIPERSCKSLVGSFFGHSVNHQKTSLFMTDLATAFSLKALKMAEKKGL